MAFTKNFDFLICKLESTPGTEETLLQADRDICVVGDTITATIDVDIDDEGSKCANGEHGENESITGVQMSEINFSIKYRWSGTATTEPNLAKLFKGCGLKEGVLDNGVGYEPLLEYDIKPMTFWLYSREGGVASQYKKMPFSGAMGNMTVAVDNNGKPIMLNFAFKAKKLIETDETTVPVIGTLNTAIPEKFLNASVGFGSVTNKRVSAFTFDIGNDVQPEYDSLEETGIAYFRIIKRAPRLNINPLMSQVAVQDIYGMFKDGTENSVLVTVPRDEPHFTLEIPVSQIIGNSGADREGLHNHELNLKCERNGTVDTDITAEATFRLVHGFSNFIMNFGNSGSGAGQFSLPISVTVDTNGYIYVVDSTNDKVNKFDSSGNLVLAWGSNGSGDGQFLTPKSIASDSNNNIYVTDSGRNDVQKFDSSGTFLISWGTVGTGDGQFQDIKSIAIDSSDNIFVSDIDALRRDVQKFNTSGVFQSKFGTSGTGDGEFQSPSYVETDSSGNILVLDIINLNVQKFNSSGVYQSKFGASGTGDGEFQTPRGLAIDSSDNSYVIDSTRDDIQQFNSSGVFQSKLGSSGTNNLQFQEPWDIECDSSDSIYAVDSDRDDVQKFRF